MVLSHLSLGRWREGYTQSEAITATLDILKYNYLSKCCQNCADSLEIFQFSEFVQFWLTYHSI